MTQARKASFRRRIDQIVQRHPNASEQISHALCRRSGVKPKQSMYSQSLEAAITAKSRPHISDFVFMGSILVDLSTVVNTGESVL